MLKKKERIYAIVPARGGSKGIKLKNLKKINGKTLIEITSKFIDDSEIFDKKIITSDNEKILNLGKKLNFQTFKRPKKISGDRISDFKVIKHCLENFHKNERPDYIAYLQPSSPIRKISHFKSAYNILRKNNYQSAWSVSPVSMKYHPLKSLKINKKNLKLFLANGKKIIARQMLDKVYIRNGAFYIFKVASLLSQKTIYLKKIYPSITDYPIINIDNLEDLKEARKLL